MSFFNTLSSDIVAMRECSVKDSYADALHAPAESTDRPVAGASDVLSPGASDVRGSARFIAPRAPVMTPADPFVTPGYSGAGWK